MCADSKMYPATATTRTGRRIISARRSRGDRATVRPPQGYGLALGLGLAEAEGLTPGTGTPGTGVPCVAPGIEPGPALTSVVKNSTFRETDSLGHPCGLTWMVFTLAARGSVSSRNRDCRCATQH